MGVFDIGQATVQKVMNKALLFFWDARIILYVTTNLKKKLMPIL